MSKDNKTLPPTLEASAEAIYLSKAEFIEKTDEFKHWIITKQNEALEKFKKDHKNLEDSILLELEKAFPKRNQSYLRQFFEIFGFIFAFFSAVMLAASLFVIAGEFLARLFEINPELVMFWGITLIYSFFGYHYLKLIRKFYKDMKIKPITKKDKISEVIIIGIGVLPYLPIWITYVLFESLKKMK